MASQSFFSRYKWPLAGIVFLVIIIYAGQSFLTTSSDTNRINTQKSTDSVKKGNITSTISASGQIETANYLAITTSVNGIVKKVYVKEGDTVKKGQKIMDITLDIEGQKSRTNAMASYLRAKNSLTEGQNRLVTLQNTKLQKEKAFDDVKESTSYQGEEQRYSFHNAENELKVAENAYNDQLNTISQLQTSLSSAAMDLQTQSPNIVAPDAGIISNITAVEGTKIENSVTQDRSIKTVASIKQTGTPIATLNVSELDINKIKVGQKVNLSLNSISGMKFEGAVVGIDKIGSVSSGVSNYPVIIKFDIDSENVLPNMGVEADIITNQKNDVLYVPTAAIKTENGKKTVTKVNGTTSETVEVETGTSDNDNTEIISGLNEGDEVEISTLPTTGFSTSTSSQNQNRGSVFGIFGGRR